jgi:hypothetical protein
MADRAYSARELLQMEYGSSRNFLTPHVIARGKLTRTVAYELSSGSGQEPGTSIYGVSVVRLHGDGTTERDHEAAACLSSLQAADEHIESLRDARSALERCRKAWAKTAMQLEMPIH